MPLTFGKNSKLLNDFKLFRTDRTISLLLIISKLYEKLVLKILKTFIKEQSNTKPPVWF